jgi:hypothetical protein
MMAAARGQDFEYDRRRRSGGEFDKNEERRQDQVLVSSLTSFCLPGQCFPRECFPGSEFEMVEDRRQKQISGFN